MKARDLIDKLSQVSPDAEVIGGTWNGRVDTYTVLDSFRKVPYDDIYPDFFGTPGAFDDRLAQIRSKDVVYLGSTFDQTDKQVISDRRLLWRLAATRRQHRSTQWKKDKMYQLLEEFGL